MREANKEVKIGVQIMQHLKLAKSGWRQKVEDFKTEELPKIVEDHVAAAKRAMAAGFDFIEIHMAHAYVLSSFLSLCNTRTDGYGGNSLNNRMKLPIEVYQAVRKTVGENFPLGVRINGEDFCIPGSTLAQSTRIASAWRQGFTRDSLDDAVQTGKAGDGKLPHRGRFRGQD
jgi:2,4-dienoyl-CoA reductase-like NADH-dependent reductase (Old Yellow Enzyme family)